LDPDRAESERHGVQGGGACPAFANQKRGTKFDRSRELIPGYKFGGGHWRSVVPKALTDRRERHGVQLVSKPEISQGAVFKLRADARARM